MSGEVRTIFTLFQFGPPGIALRPQLAAGAGGAAAGLGAAAGAGGLACGAAAGATAAVVGASDGVGATDGGGATAGAAALTTTTGVGGFACGGGAAFTTRAGVGGLTRGAAAGANVWTFGRVIAVANPGWAGRAGWGIAVKVAGALPGRFAGKPCGTWKKPGRGWEGTMAVLLRCMAAC